MQKDVTSLIHSILNAANRYLKTDGEYAYYVDPVYDIIRNRVNAEICKAMIRIGDTESVPGIVRYICSTQAPDGSWNEIHPDYDQPSALITGFIGEALVEAYDICPKDDVLHKARDYVLRNELSPGYFLKSEKYTADHLNVDVSCGSFLAKYGKRFGDKEAIEAAGRAALRTCRFQKVTGEYPYASDQGTYPYPYDIPCVHYQGVTMYYLSKIQEIIQDPKVDESLLLGAKWLASVQRPDGTFDWSKSGLMFSYYLSGAYAFAYAAFSCVSKLDKQYEKNASLSFTGLLRCLHGIMLRWEPAGWLSLPSALVTSARSAGIGQFPLREKLFRMGYTMYRQIARRRYSKTVDPRFFRKLCSIMRIHPSTIEPFNNFPDMFMTSEVLDCLSYSRQSANTKNR